MLSYSTYLGGNGQDYGNAIAVDSSGNAYVTGATRSINFPTVNAFQSYYRGGGDDYDAFVTKFYSSGSVLIYSTYLGGNAEDLGAAIAVTGESAYVTGTTYSTDFPTAKVTGFPTANPQPYGGLGDAFVTKFHSSGKELIYSTYLGGSDEDHGNSIAVFHPIFAYVTGSTESINFPTDNALQPTYAGGTDAFVKSFDQWGRTRYSTYLGGGAFDVGNGIAIDSKSNAYITGLTTSTNFPTENPLQPAIGGSVDAFVTKLNYSGIGYSTYFGGSGVEHGRAIAVDSTGSAYVTGFTASTNFQTQNPFQPTKSESYDAFVLKIRELPPASISVSPTTVFPGSSVTASRANILDPTTSDWIGLYATSTTSDESFISYRLTSGLESGNLPFTIPAGTPAGTTYELRLFRSGGIRLATSNSFTVQVTTLSVSPTTINAGGSVTATWTNIPSPSPNDWISLYGSSGEADSPTFYGRYTNGQSSGNVPFTIPLGTPAGATYELRLFSNNSYTRLATSNSFTIQVLPASF